MAEQGPKLKQVITSFEEPNPLGRVVMILEHHGVEVTIAIPTARGEGAPNAYVQAEQFLRDAADACQLAAVGLAQVSKWK